MALQSTLETIRQSLPSKYDVDRELGVGGMSRVYLARDIKHDRKVAIKVIEADVAVAIAAERFLREIKICARLTHPHILPLLDSGYAGDLPFYVMPYVDGESLRDRLDRVGRMQVDETVSLVREVADALDYAHVAGVLHRDIKPENVLLLGSHAVVLDFGVGRAISVATERQGVSKDITIAGTVVGTPAYMSPEQAAGDANTDGRSDLYSLGIMTFEMLTGHQPFRGATAQATMAKRFFEVAPRVDTLRADAPKHIVEAVAKALAREATDRFETVGAFGRALSAAAGATGTVTAASPQPSVAVLPFANVGGNADNEFLSDGITDEVIAALTRRRTLRVAARTSSYALRNEGADIALIGERLRVESVLEGSVQRAGNRVRIKARLVNATDGFQRWADQFDETVDDVFAIQDKISEAIAGALEATILGVALPSPRAQSTDATTYELYLKGRLHWNKRAEAHLHQAVELFTQAIASDPEYAPSYAGLADAYVVLAIYGVRPPNEVMPLARTNAAKALARDPALAEPHAALGMIASVYDHDWAAAEQEFGRALTLSPSHVQALVWRALAVHVPRANYAAAMDDIARARALDPLSLILRLNEGAMLAFSGENQKSADTLREALAIEPNFAIGHFFLSVAQHHLGQLVDAKASIERAIALGGGSVEMRARYACILAATGDTAGCDAIAKALEAERATQFVSPARLAQVHASRGRLDEAMQWLRTATAERDADLIYLGERRMYDPLRELPEFRRLMQENRLAAAAPRGAVVI